jgi:hypothetical protein
VPQNFKFQQVSPVLPENKGRYWTIGLKNPIFSQTDLPQKSLHPFKIPCLYTNLVRREKEG